MSAPRRYAHHPNTRKFPEATLTCYFNACDTLQYLCESAVSCLATKHERKREEQHFFWVKCQKHTVVARSVDRVSSPSFTVNTLEKKHRVMNNIKWISLECVCVCVSSVRLLCLWTWNGYFWVCVRNKQRTNRKKSLSREYSSLRNSRCTCTL